MSEGERHDKELKVGSNGEVVYGLKRITFRGDLRSRTSSLQTHLVLGGYIPFKHAKQLETTEKHEWDCNRGGKRGREPTPKSTLSGDSIWKGWGSGD